MVITFKINTIIHFWIVLDRWRAAGRPRAENSELYHDHKLVDEIIRAAHNDKNTFWRRIKRAGNPDKCKVFAIRDSNNKVVYEINEVVNVWKDHFSKNSQPRESTPFDTQDFQFVSSSVKKWYFEVEDDQFLQQHFPNEKIIVGLKTYIDSTI